MKKLKLKLTPSLLIAIVFGVLSVSSVLAASSPDFRTLIAKELANRIPLNSVYKLLGLPVSPPDKSVVSVSEPSLGAGTNNGQFGQVQCINDDCVAHVVQTNQSATTTIFSVATPFLMATTSISDVTVTPAADLVNGIGQTGATSTVELVRINVTTAATSTYSVMCASAATPYATSSISQSIIETGTSVTSTPFIESGFYNPNNGNTGTALAAPWHANSSSTNAFVNNPTFVAKLLLRISRLRF